MNAMPRARAVVALAIVGAVLGPAASSTASWSDTHCNGSSWEVRGWKRSQAKAYAQKATNKGYE